MLTPDLHLDGSLRDFVQSLLRAVTEHATAPDGEPYLVKLLRHLHDTEWAGLLHNDLAMTSWHCAEK